MSTQTNKGRVAAKAKRVLKNAGATASRGRNAISPRVTSERFGEVLRRSRVKVFVTSAFAVLAFSTIVVATTTAEPQGASAVLHRSNAASETEAFPLSLRSFEGWPAPNAPFDETSITPVESAGAPMFP